ncbi:MAG: hypothetical protein HON23_01480 [Rickettsiales bacterium]|jgi:peptidyl-prolyl cis-trans isomerase C|nr:hypothetical protein [Rickettsiales bacterium]
MVNKQTIIFNILLSSLILLVLIIYSIVANNTPRRIAIAKVNNIMVYDNDIAYYLSTLFGYDADISIANLPNNQLEGILRQYMIDYHILKLAHRSHMDNELRVQHKITANSNNIIKEIFLNEMSSEIVTKLKIATKYQEIHDALTTGSNIQYEYRVKHILVSNEDKATAIKKELKNIFFENAAQLYSLDKTSSKNGGNLGYFKEGTMIKEFEDQVKALTIGQVSNPFKTDFGWHLVKLENKNVIPAPSLDAMYEEIKTELRNEAIAEYIEEIDQGLNIKIVRKEKR